MYNLGLVLLVFAFVLFFCAAAFNALQQHYWRLIAAGLAFWVGAEIFGGVQRFIH